VGSEMCIRDSLRICNVCYRWIEPIFGYVTFSGTRLIESLGLQNPALLGRFCLRAVTV
jgi:hypothetical protein